MTANAPRSAVMPLRLDAVSKVLAGRTVLREIDLECPPGTITALLGPNGAGKTTAVGIATGLRRPDSGTALVCGIPAAAIEAGYHISVVPQDIALPESVPLARCVEFVAGHRPDAGRTPPVDQLGDRLGISALFPRRAGALSGGQRRRAMLLLGLIHAPEVLVLDEATSNLDDGTRGAVWSLVHEYVERGGAALVTSHILAEIDDHADRLVALRDGAVVLQARLADVRSRFGTSTVSIQLTDEHAARAIALVAATQHIDPTSPGRTGRISWQTSRPAELIGALVGAQIHVADLVVRPTPLPDLLSALAAGVPVASPPPAIGPATSKAAVPSPEAMAQQQ